MSAPTQQAAAPPAPAPQPKRDGRVARLMAKIGATKWAPMPEDQYTAWQDESEPLRIRFWSLVCAKTISLQHNSAYCTDSDGNELHIPNLAVILGAEEKKVYAVFREGIERGRYRKGTAKEGPQRVYICGRVLKAEGEERRTESEDECPYGLVPPAISLILKDWPKERADAFYDRWVLIDEAGDVAAAEWMLAVRAIKAKEQDTLCRDAGLAPPRRIQQEIKEDRAEVAEARGKLRKQFALLVAESVRTLEQCVRTAISVRTDNENGSARTPASLLGLDPTRRNQSERAPLVSEAPAPTSAALPSHDGEKRKYQPAGQLPNLDAEEKQAEDLLWNELPRMQRAYPHTGFASEALSRESRADQILVRRILDTVGPANAIDFSLLVADKFKGLDKNALGAKPRAPGSPSGPRSWGLILAWAEDYRRKLTEAARQDAQVATQRRRHEVRVCLEILKDPAETAEAKQQARELLRLHGVQQGAKGGMT